MIYRIVHQVNIFYVYFINIYILQILKNIIARMLNKQKTNFFFNKFS